MAGLQELDRSVAGKEVVEGVFGAEPDFDGVTMLLDVLQTWQICEFAAGCDVELESYNVDACDLFGDRMLDLNASVDL